MFRAGNSILELCRGTTSSGGGGGRSAGLCTSSCCSYFLSTLRIIDWVDLVLVPAGVEKLSCSRESPWWAPTSFPDLAIAVFFFYLQMAYRAHKLPLLRRVCQRLGLRVLSRGYDFDSPEPFALDDVVNVSPVVKVRDAALAFLFVCFVCILYFFCICVFVCKTMQLVFVVVIAIAVSTMPCFVFFFFPDDSPAERVHGSSCCRSVKSFCKATIPYLYKYEDFTGNFSVGLNNRTPVR